MRSGPRGGAPWEEGLRLAVRETGWGKAEKKAINPINPNLEALPASLKCKELGWV